MAELIKVTTSELQEAITKFDRCKEQLAAAYGKMATEVAILSPSWNGAASEAFDAQFAELVSNLRTSDETVAQAITGLRAAVSGYEELENEVSGALQGMTDAPDSPFGG